MGLSKKIVLNQRLLKRSLKIERSLLIRPRMRFVLLR